MARRGCGRPPQQRHRGLKFSPIEDALFDMLRDEAVPPDLAVQIVLRLHDHPDADRSLAITPVGNRW
jgi:hypothetical protein